GGNGITANRISGNAGAAIAVISHTTIAMIVTAGGQLESWLHAGQPDATYRIDVYASADYGPNRSGEAEAWLGSLPVLTDSSGQAVFAVPFASPPGFPVITAAATDPSGKTSGLSAQRPSTFQVPARTVRVAPDQALIFSSGAGDAVAIR